MIPFIQNTVRCVTVVWLLLLTIHGRCADNKVAHPSDACKIRCVFRAYQPGRESFEKDSVIYKRSSLSAYRYPLNERGTAYIKCLMGKYTYGDSIYLVMKISLPAKGPLLPRLNCNKNIVRAGLHYQLSPGNLSQTFLVIYGFSTQDLKDRSLVAGNLYEPWKKCPAYIKSGKKMKTVITHYYDSGKTSSQYTEYRFRNKALTKTWSEDGKIRSITKRRRGKTIEIHWDPEGKKHRYKHIDPNWRKPVRQSSPG